MRILNRVHVPWLIFTSIATLAAIVLYLANFDPETLPGLRLPSSLIQEPSDHRSVGGTPLGLIYGAISFGIFIFAVLLSLRKKIPLWRIGTVQRWLRAHIWLTFLTIPLVLLHSGFRFGGPMTTLLIVLYAIVMISGIYGLILQHQMPALMKERLPAETVFEQIPHIRAQLVATAIKMRDSFKPAPTAKPEAAASGAAAMASTAADLSTPTARAKSATGSTLTAAPVTETAPAANAAASPAKSLDTITAPSSEAAARAAEGAPIPAGTESAAARPPPESAPALSPPTPAAPKPAAAPLALDPESESTLAEFLDRQVIPYLSAKRGDRLPLGRPRFSEDTFRFVRLRIAEAYRTRVDQVQAWCDERRMLDLQTRMHHWLHGWLFVHVPFSFLLVMLTAWHAFVTLFHY